ncbi:MAG: deoxyribodipyrimidine photolyase [Chitinophagaceae bacterium]|nr:deoxyribodipyrimidine photolyase [Chitinophagaceae bacterium]
MNFPTDIKSIKNRIQQIDPVAYGTSRNYLDGKVTYLSPYISRGVISTRQIADIILQKEYPSHQVVRFIQELAWRDYYQRIWQQLGDEIFEDIRVCHSQIRTSHLPKAIADASTGIEAIDKGIKDLYQTGYMHNHLRMYVASIICNTAQSHWSLPSKWMYYHLLDGDLASNGLSWQWVAGTFSSKKYYCNQENINRFCNTSQTGTFLDLAYTDLPTQQVPSVLKELTIPALSTTLPNKIFPTLDSNLPTFLYHPYHLDPEWKKGIKANRILVLEPSHYREHPVSDKVINFILGLANQIQDLQVFAGEVSELTELRKSKEIVTKKHPAFLHFPGKKEERDWLVPELTSRFNSFFDYWKKAEKFIFSHSTPETKSNNSIPTPGALSL